MISQLIFSLLFIIAVAMFTSNVRKVIRNIKLGRDIKINDRKSERWKQMILVAFGQKKMFKRPLPALLHFVVYAGFIIINIELLEIVSDGIFGTHRLLAHYLSLEFYNLVIASFEVLAFLVAVGCIVFLCRRYIARIPRFWNKEMTKWPRTDATIILVTEIILMSLFLKMNAADHLLQSRGSEHYFKAGMFPISQYIFPYLNNFSDGSLIFVERFCWWGHIIGVFLFLNYIIWSKHFHILLAFPNVWYAKLTAKGEFTSLASVTNEVKLMLDPNAAVTPDANPGKFGAKDVMDLNWKQLMDAYSCTECGRCTSACPANITGKLLSPRKIMMDTRDRLEEIGRNIDKHGIDFKDGKSLLGNYITEEELWACTSCNACVEECPVMIDPLSIITDLRRNLVMEESKLPGELTDMMGNIENNGAPWKFSPSDRFNWAEGLDIPVMADLAARSEQPEVLFWIGCAGSFDDRYKSVVRSFAKILNEAKVKFAVLGLEETCTGDPAKRAGNEFLAQMQAMQNITTLNNYSVKNIVTACPHCFNNIKNEYPALGGNYDVMHHSAFLQKLLEDGRLVMKENNSLTGQTITYHDSCYLGRANDVYEAPRVVIDSLKVELREMKKCKTNGLCCGGGGAQVFKEEEKGNKRISTERAEQIMETGASVVAVGCPFCMTMIDDGLKQKNQEEKIKVKDIAELIAEANQL
ncbi:MAG: (Fe-S)-binding protein [Sphingobacteriales bacterium]|nr:MAG: (Fe-S)-binding protein [Sphingobacteriales bacterium]